MLDLAKMNQSQREAVRWSGGPLLLLAGPGSGKTFTITNRILYLLEQGVRPEEILVITFTRDAAESMQQRFRRMSEQYYPVNFGTFHSVFYHILQESGRFRHLNLVSESKKKNLLIPILKKIDSSKKEADISQKADVGEDVPKILSAISLYKNTEDLEKALKKLPFHRQEDFLKIFGEYRKALRMTDAVDFDDMLFECREMLTGQKEIRRYWQNRFSHILIDEFQDINPVQYEIVKLIAPVSRNVFAVGDDDQAIYGFRGSEPKLMRRFQEEFGAEQRLLDVNYRCGKQIIKASLSVIGENRDRFAKELRESADSEEGRIELRVFADKTEEQSYLVKQLREWHEIHKEDEESCVLLFRTNTHMQRMAAVLKRAGIRYQMKERAQSIYEHFIVKDLMAYLLLAAGEWKREYLLRIINKPSRYISREAVGEGRSIREIKEYYEKSFCEEGMRRKILDNLERLQHSLECIGSLSPQTAVSYILKAAGYENYLKTLAVGDAEKWQEWEELLQWLKEEAAETSDVRKWRDMQELYSEEQEKRHLAKTKVREEKIKLMTVHGAKGLEFHTVFIPDCNERVFPHGSMPDSICVEEERRIFYVAMTRAKKSLELMYLGGDMYSGLPSRFLNPLFYSSSISSSNSQLSRYSSNASATLSYSSSSAM